MNRVTKVLLLALATATLATLLLMVSLSALHASRFDGAPGVAHPERFDRPYRGAAASARPRVRATTNAASAAALDLP